jgi:hypothetical protein
MWQYGLKVIVTAIMVVAVSELGKRNSFWGAVLASLPLTSLLAFIWLYLDTGNSQRVAELSKSIFWLVLPSLCLFISLPILLRANVPFWLSLAIACVGTTAAYFAMVLILRYFNLRL